MQRLLQHFNRWMPLLFWLLIAITSVLMLIELPKKNDGLPHIDKVQHAVIFAVLTGSGLLAYAQKKWPVLLGLAVLGTVYEVLQAVFTVTRKASIYDWLADVVGILIAAGIINLLNRKKSYGRI
jgi:VanZ family protein